MVLQAYVFSNILPLTSYHARLTMYTSYHVRLTMYILPCTSYHTHLIMYVDAFIYSYYERMHY